MDLLFSPSTPMFVMGGVFGATLLLAGVAMGYLIGRRHRSGTLDSNQPEQVMNSLGGLIDWTNGFATQLQDYRTEMDRLSDKLREESKEPLAGTDVDALAQIARANDALQGRLDDAEVRLREQADTIATYMTEARTDALTGLPNRRVFDHSLRQQLDAAEHDGRRLGLIMSDIDHFKRFNDDHGHQAGDAVLQHYAKILNATLPPGAIAARIGGEEFAIVYRVDHGHQVMSLAESLRLAIEASSFHYDNKILQLTSSCGATLAISSDTTATLIERCDQALYAAKDAGRNRVVFEHGGELRDIQVELPADVPQRGAAVGEQPADADPVCTDLRSRLREFNDRAAEQTQSP